MIACSVERVPGDAATPVAPGKAQIGSPDGGTGSMNSRPATNAVMAAGLAAAMLFATAAPAVAATAATPVEPAAQSTAPVEPVPEEATSWSVLQRNFWKTLTYEISSNGTDFLVYTTLLGTASAAAPAFVVVNAATAASTYYAHETAWDWYGWNDPDTVWSIVARTVSYRATTGARAFAITYAFTGDPVVATGFAVLGGIADTVVYLANGWAWDTFIPLASTAPPSGPPVRSIDITW